jgi:hypothetical protein
MGRTARKAPNRAIGGTLGEVQNIFDPGQWADSGGWWLLVGAMVGTLVLVASKLAGPRWDDWLDERVGRGSVQDDWPDRPSHR